MTEERGAKVPQYRVISQALLERIRTGAFSFDEPLCTEGSLMAEFGCSRITVRRALEELEVKGLILRKRGIGCFVSRAAYEALGSSHEETAVPVRSAPAYALLCPAQWKREKLQAFFDGANAVFSAQDAHAVMYLTADRSEDRPQALLERMAGMDIAGIVLAHPEPDALLTGINKLLLQGKGVVTTLGHSMLAHIPSLPYDRDDAALQLVQHLTALGHTRIGVYAGDENCVSAYLMALARSGITPESDLVCRKGDAGALRRCVAAGVTAMLAQNEELLQQLTRDCTALGVHVPGSMSLCCLEACSPLPPLRRGEAQRSVTHTRFDEESMGCACAEQLLSQSRLFQPSLPLLQKATLNPGTTTAAPADHGSTKRRETK